MSTTIDEVISQARQRGVRDLPEPSHLLHVRVWPASGGRWVAEVGEPPHNKVVGADMYASKDEAAAAAVAYVTQERSALVSALPSDLADAARLLPEPTVTEWEA